MRTDLPSIFLIYGDVRPPAPGMWLSFAQGQALASLAILACQISGTNANEMTAARAWLACLQGLVFQQHHLVHYVCVV